MTSVDTENQTGQEQASGCGCGSGCCGGGGSARIPALVARSIPREVREGAILGALFSLPGGASLDLISNADPQPLLGLLQEADPDGFASEYLSTGPDDWTVRFTRAQ